MDRRNYQFRILLFLVILISGYGTQVYSASPLPALLKSEKVIKQETDNYLINIKDPQTTNPSINQAIDRMIQKNIAAFKHDLGPKRISPNWRNELWCSYTTSQYSSRIGSLRFDIYTFTGGAHGNTQVVTKTYDFKTGKEIKLADIFNTKNNYLTQIVNLIRPKLTKQLQMPTLDWITTGTAPVPKNYQAFLLTPSSIIFIFQQYQVAARVEGMPEVEIKWEQVKELLNPQFKM
jgi:hypothetical protein